jgi:hypothetical protein
LDVEVDLFKNIMKFLALVIVVFSNNSFSAMFRRVHPLEFPEPVIVPFVALPNLETPGHQGVVNVNNALFGPLAPGTIHLLHAQNGEQFTQIRVPDANNAEIYFNVNGQQPTTQQTVIWSCANVDNTPTSPITEWYMQVFGWSRAAVAGTAPLAPAILLLQIGK